MVNLIVLILGLSIRYLFQLKDPDAPIMMFSGNHSHLYHLVRSNIRGGLSLVFNRWQESEKTRINPHYFGANAKITKNCTGIDVSSMYLSCLMREMPTGPYIYRRKENNFKRETSHRYIEKAMEFIKYMEIKLGVKIQHQLNKGEKRIGGRRLPVDGYGIAPNGDEIVLQFSGCYWHSHCCTNVPVGRGGDEISDTENRLQTYNNLQYLQKLGVKLFHIWECEHDDRKHNNLEYKEICNSVKTYPDKRYMLTEETIIEDIKTGKIFGLVEIDIHTPDNLKSNYAVWQPIIKHAIISRSDVLTHMREFAESNGLLKKPSKSLIGSYFGNKILMATPLVSWLLNHGLIVTKVYCVIQYTPVKCFTRFGNEVISARRAGSIDPTKQIVAASCKLIGKIKT